HDGGNADARELRHSIRDERPRAANPDYFISCFYRRGTGSFARSEGAGRIGNQFCGEMKIRAACGEGLDTPKETLNKPCLRGSKSAGANVSDPFSLFPPLRRFACDREPSLRLKPMPEATVFSAADTGSPERTPRTAGWHSSSVRDNAPSQIRTSASSPQTRAPPSSAPSTWCGSSPAPLRQYDSCSGSADGCSPEPVARTPGSLRSVRGKPDRPTRAFLPRARDRAVP